jgi:hypothetical protein
MRGSGHAFSLSLLLLAATAVTVLLSGPAFAGPCRVSRVDRAGPDTVRLYVAEAQNNPVQFIHAGKKQWFDVAPPGFGFKAALGDRVLSNNLQCVMTVSESNGRIGVDLRGFPGSAHVRGWFPEPADVFVPAQ